MDLWSINLKRIVGHKKSRGGGNKKIIFFKVLMLNALFYFNLCIISYSMAVAKFRELSKERFEKTGTN